RQTPRTVGPWRWTRPANASGSSPAAYRPSNSASQYSGPADSPPRTRRHQTPTSGLGIAGRAPRTRYFPFKLYWGPTWISVGENRWKLFHQPNALNDDLLVILNHQVFDSDRRFEQHAFDRRGARF